MAKFEVGFSIKTSLFDKLKDTIVNVFGRKARNNLSDFRGPVEEALSEGIINSRSEFQANEQQAAELGIGAGGKIDTRRIFEAWQQLLPDRPENITKFTIRKSPSGKTSIGTITISIDEEAFFNAELSNIDTPDSNKIDSIPWMKYLIEGAPINTGFRFLKFKNHGKVISRTGRGIMVKGGFWSFPPQKPNAFGNLSKEIQRQIEIAIRRDIGKVL